MSTSDQVAHDPQHILGQDRGLTLALEKHRQRADTRAEAELDLLPGVATTEGLWHVGSPTVRCLPS